MINKKSPNPVDIYVGSRVRMRRVLLGMSQEKLGDALGITFQQVQKYEKGTNRVGASRLQAISTTLGVKPSFFFEGNDTSEVVAEVDGEVVGINGFLSSKEGLDLNRSFTKIKDTTVRKRVVALVKALSASSFEGSAEAED
jgi:transcriptional regulator with XRE-family HTH domain